MKTLRRYHYLPQFYIKGFENDKQELTIYDKQEKRFLGPVSSAESLFWEWNHSALTINEQRNNQLERLYGELERLIAPGYIKVTGQRGRIRYDIMDFFHLLLLVSLSYPRSSVDVKEARKFLQAPANRALFSEVYKTLYQEEANEDFLRETENKLGPIPLYHFLQPVLDFRSLNIHSTIDYWEIYRSDQGQGTTRYILGIQPIIFKTPPERNILESTLIFPLTKDLTLSHHPENKVKSINPPARKHIDLILFLQAQRYVAGSSRAYLESIQSLAQTMDTQGKVEALRKEIFS